MNSSSTPDPTVSMYFIAGLLLLMSVFSFFAPKTELSSSETPSNYLSLTQVETTFNNSY